MCIAITTCATSWSTFRTSIYNTCNISLKHLKHAIATCTLSVASACCLDKWRLVDAEVDAYAELVGGTDLGRGRGRRMERGRGGRCASRRAAGTRAWPRAGPIPEHRHATRWASRQCGRGWRGQDAKRAGDLYGSVCLDRQPIISITVWYS
jgi:hypothetical protein